MKKRLLALIAVAFMVSMPIEAYCDSVTQAREKILILEDLIDQAEDMNIDVAREECAVWMANTFLMYADWDARNVDQNVFQYSTWIHYEKDSQRLAEELPEFERQEVIKLLDSAISDIKAVMDGSLVRRAVPKVDWESVTLQGDQFVSNGQPIFINDYFTKPDLLKNDYCGKVDGDRLTLRHIDDMDGTLSQTGKDLIHKPSKYSGYVILWHGAPDWLKAKDANINVGGRHFTSYDVDNPLVREAWESTFKSIVPKIKGKKFLDQGYILSNEPHFFSEEGVWATSVVSDYTQAKFKVWLKETHHDIARLNKLWKTNFESFDAVEFKVPFAGNLKGTPAGYDWMKFNQDRIYDWFKFLRDGIKKYDKDVPIHIKLVPRIFRQDIRDHGIDYERLMQMCDILGNDSKIFGRMKNSTEKEPWEDRFCFNYVDVGVPYDFFESVAPGKTNINSESHYLSSTAYRDIYMTKEFTRSAYWLATMQGMSISYSWFWAREYNGGVRRDLRGNTNWGDKAMLEAYVASVAQQPRVAHEVSTTYMDLNAFGREMAEFQRQARPARIFYSETSGINQNDYMEGSLIPLHTTLFFEGNPVGFATKDVLNQQDNSEWSVVMVKNSKYVKESEIEALQKYLDNGGTVLIDNVSLKMNEYGERSKLKLKQSKGTLIKVKSDSEYLSEGVKVMAKDGALPKIMLTEQNSINLRTCLWRVIPNGEESYLMNIINLGREDATLTLSSDNSEIKSIKDLFDGDVKENGFKIASQQVMMLEIRK